MKIEVEDTGGLSRRISFAVPKAKVEAEWASFLDEVRSKVDVPGFRKGKATDEALQAKLGDVARAEVSGRLIYNAVVDSMRDEELPIVGSPVLVESDRATDKRKFAGHFKLDGSFEFAADVEYEPELDVTDYMGVDVVGKMPTSDDWVVERLAEYQDTFAERNEVERSIQVNDEIIIDFEGFIGEETVPNSRGDYQTMLVGQGGFIPGFEDALIGKVANEPFSFDVTFPANYKSEDIAGKEVNFKCFIHSVTEVTAHPINDELAQMVSFDDLNALKADLASKVSDEFEKPIKAKLFEQIINHVIIKNPFIVPNAWVESETGVTAQRLGMKEMPTDPAVIDSLKEVAKRVVQQNFILDKVYEKEESIHLTPDDIHAFLAEEANRLDKDVEYLLSHLRNSGQYEGFISFQEHQRTIDFLLNNANFTEEVTDG